MLLTIRIGEKKSTLLEDLLPVLGMRKSTSSYVEKENSLEFRK